MRANRLVVVVVAMVLAGSQLAIAGNRRRSAVGDERRVEIEGILKSVAPPILVVTTSHQEDVTVTLADNTVIRHGDTPVAAADLAAGQRVHVKGRRSNDVTTALEIEVQNENEPEGEAEVSGVVKSVGTSSLVVTTATGDVTVNVDSNTVIRSKAAALTLADIKIGDRLEAEGTRVDAQTLQAKHIQVETENENEHPAEAEIRGVVKSVGAASLVVTTSSGDITVQVDGSTKIEKHGAAIALSDINVGDSVEAEGTVVDAQTLQAKRISVEHENENENENEAEVRGSVKSVGASSLVVTTSKGDVTVQADANTQIRKKGDRIQLADIKTGDQVEAEGTLVDAQTLKATKISVESSGHH